MTYAGMRVRAAGTIVCAGGRRTAVQVGQGADRGRQGIEQFSLTDCSRSRSSPSDLEPVFHRFILRAQPCKALEQLADSPVAHYNNLCT